MKTLIFDTETTGLPVSTLARIDRQPKIIEFYGLTLDKYYRKVGEFESLIRCGHRLPPLITKITGITDNILKKEGKEMKDVWPELRDYVMGHNLFIAHNADFDARMLEFEAIRQGDKEFIKWLMEVQHCRALICTVNYSEYQLGRRMHLNELYQRVVGKPMREAHRARADVEALTEIVIQSKMTNGTYTS